MPGKKDPVKEDLYYNDVENIYQEIVKNEELHRKFREYCQEYENDKYKDNDDLMEKIENIIKENVEYSSVFYFDILEELMRREGVAVNWGEADG